ncbi:MAG TPA: hypothetical protein DD789_09510 [Firmicutes bacterium]|jgi:hypothetical protein|nr:hypothetical protein [Bacillota bacterium]
MKARAAEYWVIGILTVGAIFFINQAQNVSSATLPGGIGPRTFPLIIFWAILILTACLVGAIIWEKVKEKKVVSIEVESHTNLIWRIIPYIPRQTLIVIAMCLLLVFLWQYLGFIIVAFLFVAGASLFLAPAEKRSIPRSLVLAALFAVVIYALFVYVFKIPLS